VEILFILEQRFLTGARRSGPKYHSTKRILLWRHVEKQFSSSFSSTASCICC